MATATPKNYLITGSGRGIGRGLSRLLLHRGHRVFLLDSNETELLHTAAILSKDFKPGIDFDYARRDLCVPFEIRAAAFAAGELFGNHLDCLINNAAYTGGVGGDHLEDLTLEDWNASIETNLTAPMLMSQACLPMLRKGGQREQGGSIIHMSSTRAFMAEANNEGYSATKAGLLGLTQSMAVSLAQDGVRVNAILPGWINVTNECKKADVKGQKWEEGLSKEDHEWHLTGRVGKVEDILAAVEYLANNEGVTGSELVVDGGVSRRMVYPE